MNQAINDDFIDKLNAIPPQVNKMLREIRQIDLQVLQLHSKIEPLRQLALEMGQKYAQKKNLKLKGEIDELVRQISQKHDAIMKLSDQKVLLARQLYNCIDEPTQELDRDITKQEILDNAPTNQHLKGKPKRGQKQNYWEYDISEPCYCYCRRPSFGSMVMCQNPYCETQWFHIQCIQQKLLGDKWYCLECRRSRTKIRDSKAQTRKATIQ